MTLKMSNYMGLIPTLLTSAPASAQDGHAEASGGLPQFDPTWWPSQVFWLALCFIVLYVVFSRVTLPRISGTIEARKARIEADMKQAELLSAQAEEVKNGYEQALKQASQSASAEIREADESAKARLNDALTAFRARYDAQISAAETRLAQSSKTALDSMEAIAAEIAAQAAEKIAGITADQTQAENVVRSLSHKAKAA